VIRSVHRGTETRIASEQLDPADALHVCPEQTAPGCGTTNARMDRPSGVNDDARERFLIFPRLGRRADIQSRETRSEWLEPYAALMTRQSPEAIPRMSAR
jgi:hypothetical protein